MQIKCKEPPTLFTNQSIMKKLLLLFYITFPSFVFAQITLSTQITSATCTANGVLEITANGGVAPYSYQIIGAPLGLTRPLQSSNRFEALSGGIYTVQVTDITNATATASATVISTYILPSLPTVAVQGSTVTMTANNGRAPFRYAYALVGDTTFWTNGHLTSNNVFDCVPNGDYIFRTYDACGNYFPVGVVINANGVLPRAACNVNANNTTNITYFFPTNAITPYTFTCTSNTGIVTNSTTGNFLNLSGCSFSVTYTDKCGISYPAQTYNCAAPIPLCGKVSCFNPKDGSVTLSALGGRSPYIFSAVNGSTVLASNTTGIFTNLPRQIYSQNFEITDNCGQKTWLRIDATASQSVKHECPYNDTIVINYNHGYTVYSPCDTVDKSPSPVTMSIYNTTNSLIYTHNYPGAINNVISSLVAPISAGYYAVFSNNCGQKDTTLLKQEAIHDARLNCLNWSNGTADLQAFGGVPPYTYIAYDTPMPYTTNATGSFGGLVHPLNSNEYRFYVLDQCMDTLVVKARHHTMYAEYKCPFNDTVYLKTNDPYFYTYTNRGDAEHPYGFPLTIKYYHDSNILDTRIVTDSSVTQVKFGIVPFPDATTYIEILSACGGLDIIYPNTRRLRIKSSASCDTIRTVFLTSTGGATAQFSLYHNNVLIMQNSTGIFPNITDGGQYFINATINGGCLARDSIMIDSLVKPVFQLGVYSIPLSGACKQVYHLRTSNGDITLKKVNGTLIGLNSSFTGLLPGDYLYKRTGCSFDTLHLPALNWNLTGVSNMHLNCNGTANFSLNGANQIPYYSQNINNIFGTSSNIINLNFRDVYGILGLSTNATGNAFSNVPMGTTYKAVLIPNTAYYPYSQNCPLDTLTFTTPLYTRPTLTATSSVLCNGSTSGSITATAINGTPFYSFQLLNPPAGYTLPTTLSSSSNSVTFTGLTAGTYHFLMDDSCHISADFDATVGVYGFTPSFERYCNGDVRLSLPDISNASFVWQNTGGTTIGTSHEVRFFNLAAGDYFVTVTVNGNCTFTHTIAVPAALCPPILANAGADQVGLLNNFTLAANLPTNGATGTWTQLGGLAQATFTNANSATTSVNLPTPGTYALVWTIDGGSCGCISSDTLLLTQCVISDTLRATLNPTPPACNSAGAQIAVVPDASASPASWQYRWSYNGLNTATITGLPAGTYTVTITDGRPCTVPLILSATVNNFSNTQINNMVTCNGGSNGSATVFVLGGIPPYTYQWNVSPPNAVGNSINNVAAGTYTLSITDATNCTAVRTVIITEPVGMILQLSQQPTFCYHSCDGAVSVDTIIGGVPTYNYSWSNGYVLRRFDNQCAGIYTVTVSDFNSCTKSATITITQPDTLLINLTAMAAANCTNADGSASVTATGGNGGYIYYWDNTNPNATATNLTSGMHSVLVTDTKGCKRRDSIFINTSPAIIGSITPTSIEEAKCFGTCTGQITVTTITNGVAPYSFLWSNGDTQITADSLCASNRYTVTVTDAVGCTATTFADMTERPELQITPTTTNVRCFQEANGRVNTNITGGTAPYSFLWSNARANDSLLNIRAGIYTLRVTDFNNCVITSTVTVTEPPLLTARIDNLNPILCSGERTGNLTAIVTGGSPDYMYQYTGQPFASVVPNLANIGGGNYNVTVTDTHNCSAVATIRVDDPLPMILTFPTVRDAGCYGAVGGIIIANTVGGTGNPRFYPYIWNLPSSTNDTLRNILAGTYTATVTDLNGCTQSLSATIVNKTAPAIDSTHLYPPTCNGYTNGAIKIFASQGVPPYTYQWNPNPQSSVIDSITGLRSGYYNVTITDNAGCFHTARIALGQPFPIVANVTTLPPICYGTPTGKIIISNILNAQPPGSETFSIGSTTFDTSHIYTDLAPNEYLVTIKDSLGCILQKTAYISFGFPFSVDITGEQIIDLGDTLHLKATLNNYSAVRYEWQILDFNKNILQSIAGNNVTRFYNTAINDRIFINLGGYAVVIATDSLGCVATDTMRFLIKDKYEVYIPNIFTPNNDGVNDVFTAYGGASARQIALMRIFDRWGELIYENTNIPLGGTRARETWDGTFKEQSLNNGVFSYYIEVDFVDNSHQIFMGDVTLKR